MRGPEDHGFRKSLDKLAVLRPVAASRPTKFVGILGRSASRWRSNGESLTAPPYARHDSRCTSSSLAPAASFFTLLPRRLLIDERLRRRLGPVLPGDQITAEFRAYRGGYTSV